MKRKRDKEKKNRKRRYDAGKRLKQPKKPKY